MILVIVCGRLANDPRAERLAFLADRGKALVRQRGDAFLQPVPDATSLANHLSQREIARLLVNELVDAGLVLLGVQAGGPG